MATILKVCPYFLQFICLLSAFVITTNADCGVCQLNRVACVSTTTFHKCWEADTPDRSQLFHCPPGLECTTATAICMQANTIIGPSCGDNSRCGNCGAHSTNLFACQGRTTYQMCYGAAHPTGDLGTCPTGYACDANSDFICVPEAQLETYTCDLPDATPPPTNSNTDSPVASSADIMCAQAGAVGLYPGSSYLSDCNKYVECYYSNGELKGREYTCPNGTYYIVEGNRCARSKPPNCIT